MCGRFAPKDKSWAELCEMNELASVPAELLLFHRYNVAPTQQVLVVRKGGAGREAAMLRWDLAPSWRKDFKSGPPVINARAETIADKPTFRVACRKRRCLIPADGFYEWQRSSKLSGGKLQ